MKTETVVHPFAPIWDKDSRVLILGSFPSVVSREQSFYYANKTNRFWPVLAEVFGEEIKDREAFCHEHHIALWDVIHSCRIHGSSDASIQDVQVNDLHEILKSSQIHTVFTTGGKASRLYEKYMHYDLEHIALPSTSSANARMSREELVRIYSIIREKADE